MLEIKIPSSEYWDESRETFVEIPGMDLVLEHSLISLSRWESKWHKPFLQKEDKNVEETIDYIRCMTLTRNVPPEIYRNITNDIIIKVSDYIGDSMTATWFSEEDNKRSHNREVVTAEVIYYWMIALNIPFECQKWHLNRLLTLIRVCNIKNAPPKKRSRSEIAKSNAAINAARRKALNSRG